MSVIVDANLVKVKKAVFASGSYNHSIEVLTKDFVKLEEAILGSFGVKKKIKKQKVVAKKRKAPVKKLAKKPAKKKVVASKKVVKKVAKKSVKKKIVAKKKK